MLLGSIIGIALVVVAFGAIATVAVEDELDLERDC